MLMRTHVILASKDHVYGLMEIVMLILVANLLIGLLTLNVRRYQTSALQMVLIVCP